MTTPLRLLIAEDRLADAELILHELRRAGFDPDWRWVETEADYLTELHDGLDIILSDYTMPQFSGMRALRLLQEHHLDIPFIIITSTVSEEVAVECMKQGAADYLLKDRLARLGPAIQQAIQKKLLRDEKQRAQHALQEEAQISAALARMGRELIASLDTPTILERLCQLTAEVLECDQSATIFWQPEDTVYTIAASHGYTAEQQETFRVLKISRESFADLLVRLEEQEVVEVTAEPFQALVPGSLFQQFDATTVLHLALRRGRELIGFQTASHCRRIEFATIRKRVAQGITQLASLALENARLLEQAESANRLKSGFLATISHELRTPLHIIRGYTDLLLDGEFGSLTAELADPLRRIDKSTRDLFELITATLDVSRLEAGQLPIQMQDIEVVELLTEIEQETAEEKEKPDLSMEWRIVSPLPLLHTDRTKLRVILKNLLSNAVKFTQTGRVTVRVCPRDSGIEFCVVDTGIGIAPEALGIIFEPFRQVESYMTRRYGGVGLGLYIVRRFVELLQGRIDVDSMIGQGSTFRVWLPLNLPSP